MGVNTKFNCSIGTRDGEDVSRELDMLQNVGGSNYEKYYNEVDGTDAEPSIIHDVIHG